MILFDLYKMGLIKNFTELVIRDDDFHLVGKGTIKDSSITPYHECEVLSFTWENQHRIFIDI